MTIRRTRHGRAVRLAALCGLSWLPLMAGQALAGPIGGVVTAGSATITTPSAVKTVINQASSKAIIDWQGFSIAQGSQVQFNNGSGATLNRVTGGAVSSIDGLLSATGSVYLINPSGVIVGRSGVVNVGGGFVASTLDLPDSQFLSGGPLTFTGSSAAAVVNYGKIGALGGDVALIAAAVDNEGGITAANGSAGLIAGYQVILTDGALDDGRFQVLLGGATTSVVNGGQIQAAVAELRANGGNIYALAGNATGVIQATGVASGGGKVFLVAEGGELDLAGQITARSVDGAGGTIETSGSTVKIGAADIDAGPGGSWRLDPNDLTIDQTAANTIMASLNGGTNVTQQTTSAGTGGSGNITVASPIAWSSGATLTLDAFNNIVVDAPITFGGKSGAGLILDAANALVINANVTVKGAGAVTLDYGASAPTNLGFTNGAALTFANADGSPATSSAGGGLTVNGQAYTLLYKLAQAGSTGPDTGTDDVAGIDHLGDSGHYALATDLDGAGATFSAPLVGQPFVGVFEGLGHKISNLTAGNDAYDGPGGGGVFDTIGTGGVARDVGVVNADVSFFAYAGGLAGVNYGEITSAYVTGSVGSDENAGGLVGINYGAIVSSYATGAVSGSAGSNAGGLVGWNAVTDTGASAGSISASYAASSVSGEAVGGLVGRNGEAAVAVVTDKLGTITDSYAASTVYPEYGEGGGLVGINYGSVTSSLAVGQVMTSLGSNLGGLIGANVSGGVISANYWSPATTGVAVAVGVNESGGGVGNPSQFSGITPLTTAQLLSQLPSGFSSSVWGQVAGQSYPYFLWQYPTAPGVISGSAYITPSAYDLVRGLGTTVAALANGVPVGAAVAGANGYYQILTPPGALQNADVLAYLPAAPGAQMGEGFAQNVTGAAGDVDIYPGVLTASTSASSLSGFAQALSTAQGANTGPAFLFTVQNGVLTPQAGAGLTLNAASSFTVDQALALGTAPLSITAGGTFYDNAALSGGVVSLAATAGNLSLGAPVSGASSMTLTSAGALSESGLGAITTPALVSHSGGLTYLPGANMIASLGGDTAVGAFFETNAEALTVAGPVSASGNTTVGTTSGSLTVQSSITGGGTSYVYAQGLLTVNAPISSSADLILQSKTRDIVIGAPVSAASTMTLIGAGAVYETPGGSITANLLNVTANSDIDLYGPNAIVTIGVDHTNSGPNQIRQ